MGFSTFQAVIQLRLTSDMFTGKGRVHCTQNRGKVWSLTIWGPQVTLLSFAGSPQTGTQCWRIPPASLATWDPRALGRRGFLPRFHYIDVRLVCVASLKGLFTNLFSLLQISYFG